MKNLFRVVFLTLTLVSFQSQTFAADNNTITFGIVPQQSASKMAKLWNPVLNELTKKTGIKFRFKTAKNIPTFEKRLLSGEYDVAYMNPYHFTVFNKKPGYKAIAHARDKRIHGILVVHKDSPYQSIEDLRNKKIAFPSPAAFAATLLTGARLKKEGIPFEKKFVSSHDSVYRNVATKRFSAGGGVIRTLKNMDKKTQDNLRILWKSEGYTPHAIAIHPNMDNALKNKLQNALVMLDTTEEGKKLLKAIRIKGFSIAYDKDWDDVRSLNIDLLENMIE